MKRWLTASALLIVIIAAVLLLREKKESVLLVSMDAFRWDYSDIYSTPVLDLLAAEGVKAKSLIPAYPTKTFPNHYTIATGLYPDHHGIISNTFYDADLQSLYRIGDREMVEDGRFYGGEPVWNTAGRQGLVSASMFWVGSEAPVNGRYPDIWNRYDGSVEYYSRLDSVVRWFSLPVKKRPRFVTLYFDEPDGISHDYGPVSPQTDSVVVYLDNLLGELLERLESVPRSRRINVIIVSDHGMGEVSSDRVVNLVDHVPDDLVEFYTGGSPSILVDPVDEFRDSVAAIINKIPHVKAYTAETMPAHYNYGTHPRFPGIVAEADSAWSIIASDRPGYSMRSRGTHGYDPANTDMHGIFYAMGPSFKKGIQTDSFENVNLYGIICRILDIEPGPYDGDPESVGEIFKK